MEHDIRDIELTVPDRKPADRTIKRAVRVPVVTRHWPHSGQNGECVVRKVSKREMNKLWKKAGIAV